MPKLDACAFFGDQGFYYTGKQPDVYRGVLVT